MATVPYQVGGIDWNALLQNAIGAQVDRSVDSEQHTTGTQKQDQQSTQTQNQNTTVGGSNASRGSQNTTQNQTTSGSNSLSGTTVTQTSGQQETADQRTYAGTESVNADTKGLREILSRQLAGITPEMLNAIFSEGSKAAPQLLTTQANALGARLGNNTPLAQALSMMQGQLTSKAADVNLQMLRDAQGTAGKIADMTRVTSTAGSDSRVSKTKTNQVQATTTLQNQIMNQLVNGITNANSEQTSTNNQVTNVAGTVSNNATSNTTTTQDVTAAEHESKLQTINMNVARGLAGGLAAGISINELFKAATGQGFTGNLQDFISYLNGGGLSVDLTGAGQGGGILGEGSAVLPDVLRGGGMQTIPADYAPDYSQYTDVPTPDEIPVEFGLADGGQLADVKPLIKKEEVDQRDPMDFDITAMLDGIVQMGLQHAMGQQGGQAQQSQAAPASSQQLSQEDIAGAADDVNTSPDNQGGLGSNWRTDKPGAVTRKIGRKADQGTGDSLTPGEADPTQTEGFMKFLGVQGTDNVFETYDANGNYTGTGRWSQKGSWVEDAMLAAAAMFTPGGNMIMGAGAVDSAADRGDVGGMLAGLASTVAGGSKLGGAAWAGTAANVAKGIGVANRVIKPGRADGGLVKGPGTGISDDVEAETEEGEPIKLSNEEFVIPADTVKAFGVDFFEDLIERTHTPAALQRAMGVK